MTTIHQVHELENALFEFVQQSQTSDSDDKLSQLKQHLIVNEIAEYETKVNYLQQKVTRIEQKLVEPSKLISTKVVPLVAKQLQASLLKSWTSQTSALTPVVEQVIARKLIQDKDEILEALTPVVLQILEKNSPESQSPQQVQDTEQEQKLLEQNQRLERLESVVQQLGETVLYATQAVDCLAQRVNVISDQIQDRKASA